MSARPEARLAALPAALPERCDLLVIGSGAAGMAAAITASHLGLRPVVVEKAPVFGGSTAVSGGAIWVPDNPLMRAAGIEDSAEDALTYIAGETGNRMNRPLVEAFLHNGPRMVDFFHHHTALRFTHRSHSPDYHSERPGARMGGRVLDAEDYDGARLGPWLARLRPPIAEFTLFGGMMVNRFDIGHLLKMTRAPASALHVARLLLRHGRDRLRHGRGTRLVLGAAIAGRLAETLIERGIPLVLDCALVGLECDADGRVTGARLRDAQGADRRVTALRGVVLAAGGYAHDAARRAATMPHVAAGLPHYSMSPAAGTGDALRAAEAVGAAVLDSNDNAGFWTPVSLLPDGAAGAVRPFPHLFLDRAKPGVIAVGQDGRRFGNEALSYHDFTQALVAHLLASGTRSAFLIADHRALRRYGLGAVPAFPGSIRRHLASGYLRRGATPGQLAQALGIDGAGLAATLEGFNRDAADGVDRSFGKGSTAYQTYLGDADQRPNPCLRPLTEAPFYGIEIFPGDIGTSVGLSIDPDGRVLRADGSPIAGLLACGNDANSIMAGAYPGAGITLGPALTFGYIAAHTAAGRAPSG